MSLSIEIVLTLLAGPITAIFTVFLQSSYSKFRNKRKIFAGLIDELIINHEVLDNSDKLGSKDSKWSNMNLHNESYLAFVKNGYLKSIDVQMQAELGSLYMDFNAINSISEDVNGNKIKETKMKSSCLANKDYIERYTSAWKYNSYFGYLFVGLIHLCKNIKVKAYHVIRNPNQDDKIQEVSTAYPKVEIKYDDLVYYSKTQEAQSRNSE